MGLTARTVLTWIICTRPCTGWDSTRWGADSQCFLESYLTTELKTTGVEIQKINWTSMKTHLLKVLLMYKKIDYQYLNNSFILDTNNGYCEGMALGFQIENIVHTKNTAKAMMGHRDYQILTNVMTYHNMSLLSSRNHRAFLGADKMALVLKNLGIEPRLNGNKELSQNLQNLSLKDIFLTYTDKGIDLLCRANLFMKSHHRKMNIFIAQWIELWMEIISLEIIVYGEEEKAKMRNLQYTCLQITDPKDLGKIRAEKLDLCIKSQEVENQEKGRLYKRSSFFIIFTG